MSTAGATITQVHEMQAVIASDVMRRLFAMIERVARHPAAVLITGETGSGKELIARAVHFHSSRSTKAWVDVNCAALPEHLVESELFGYEKGAFSGADTGKPGLFELADKGTLFLDEIGELEPRVQVKLLRVLDGSPYYRLGGSRKINVDVRIIAATNQPLVEAIRTGRFRSDLFHRLSQFQLRIPPLRQRPEDVVALAEHFLQQQRPGGSFSTAAMSRILAYSWPGNIRELRNVVMQSAMAAAHSVIGPDDLPSDIFGGGPISSAEPGTTSVPGNPSAPASAALASAALDDMERDAIMKALQRTGGHQGQAADLLGISRRTLSRKLKQYREERSSVAPLGELSSELEKQFRAHVELPVIVSCGDVSATVKSINISRTGIAVEKMEQPFETASSGDLGIQFTLPNHAVVRAAGRIIWADVQGRAGIRFSHAPSEGCEPLKAWLAERQRNEGWTSASQ
ncbi:MAG: sigma 54-interacting transcriptional regulator [Candidatus Korobacteraceae bacterium]